MKTITLKTDDTFFEHVTQLAKSLHVSKSELIRTSIREYENFIKRKALKEQIKLASYNVRAQNQHVLDDFDKTIDDGLDDV